MHRATQRGRVTVWRTELGSRGIGLAAYTTTASDGRGFGDTAVIATIAGLDGDGADLWSWAAGHTGSLNDDVNARWLICIGWAARLTSCPSNIDLPNPEWSVDISRRVTLEKPSYGHESLALARLTLTDPDALKRAEHLLPGP
jgi:hypothetical protein